jgi:dTDP-glucose 4,6-dehydratase
MKTIVTGGAGFIGSEFVRQWHTLHPDQEVVIFDKITYAVLPENLKALSDLPNVRIERGDIANKNDVDRICHGAGLIVHFAAETHVDRSIKTPLDFITTNLLGTAQLLEYVREHRCAMHHVSTDEVYGQLPLDQPEIRFNEQTPYNPSSPYSASKAGSDMLVRSYVHTFGIHATISNTSNNYGPWQYPEKLIPVMILKALAGEALPVYGNGQNIRDWVHVSDHARGIIACIARGIPGETYCFGGDAERTNLQVVSAILNAMGKDDSQISFVADRPGHDLRYAIDSSKAKTNLSWNQEFSFETGITEVVQWYRDNANRLRLDEQGSHL